MIEIELMNAAASMARRAGDLALVGRSTLDRSTDVGTKSTATDMVTRWDSASENLIVSDIEARRPDDGIIGEEGSTKESRSGVSWLVDPIDGTTNFLYGLAGWAVSIAAVDLSGTLAGAVYLPATREMFVAARGHGSWLGGRRLACSPSGELATALVGTGFSYSSERRAKQGERVANLLPNVRDIRRTGAAAPDLCYVADGRLDAYFEENLQPWDLAAGLLIATEAGARASDFAGGPPVPSNVLVSAPDIHDRLLDLIAPSPNRRDPTL
ncbi:MAG: inositol monophosphatase [Acidimicrobiales bacterium mtb01]|nr:inositol monophosphatase [Actinomycetota bacterium]TEX44986.1 MAG: inositol monophosphatase [Acidimicrobiales bacterium mtb01]